MKKAIFSVILLVFCLSAAAIAQDQETYVKDLMEINFFGGGGVPSGDIKDFYDSVGAKTGINFGLDAGFFISNNVVGGFNFTYTQMGIDDQALAGDLHHKIYNPNLYLKYYFNGASDFVPYLKAFVGADFPKFATYVASTAGNRYREISYDPVLAYGGGAGLFMFTTDFSGLFAEINYHRAESSGSKADYNGIDYTFKSNINMIDIHAGIRILIAPPQ